MPRKKGSKNRFPSKIACSQCGIEKGITPDRWEKLLSKEPDIEEVKKYYVCRGCRKDKNLTRLGDLKHVPKKREPKKEINLPAFNPPERRGTPIDLKKSENIIRMTSNPDQCLRPDIFLDSGRICNQCHFQEHCKCSIKTFDASAPITTGSSIKALVKKGKKSKKKKKKVA